ncbi:hypothetical protein SAMN05421858_3256 [Haladaptatus litoreus]|uniref:Uncharacterized protein n=1 Tax=Haladaptatus litoreus TaxID=553468 RepID=A0A1N7CU64_9EURY|nr:hypothetical protein [Haladaptatus litoreus]SIR67119.1 hypothetical protein SAMN05421858_3256 [Haladaptatus litoreus]
MAHDYPKIVAQIVEYNTGDIAPDAIDRNYIAQIADHHSCFISGDLDNTLDNALERGLLEEHSAGYMSTKQVNDVVPGYNPD